MRGQSRFVTILVPLVGTVVGGALGAFGFAHRAAFAQLYAA